MSQWAYDAAISFLSSLLTSTPPAPLSPPPPVPPSPGLAPPPPPPPPSSPHTTSSSPDPTPSHTPHSSQPSSLTDAEAAAVGAAIGRGQNPPWKTGRTRRAASGGTSGSLSSKGSLGGECGAVREVVWVVSAVQGRWCSDECGAGEVVGWLSGSMRMGCCTCTVPFKSAPGSYTAKFGTLCVQPIPFLLHTVSPPALHNDKLWYFNSSIRDIPR
ncbi:unnamed protein product [Closterium sp. NIES-64]|nr:unnamed protein product [Closterium sp. NIES-64]